MRRTVLTLLGLVCVFLAIQSRPTVTVPSTGNCVRCRGMSCDQWQRVQRKMRQLTASAAASDGLQFDVQEDNQTNINSGDNYFGDILLTEEQVDELLELQEEKLQKETLQNEKLQKEKFFRGDERRRQKRALRKSASTRWSLPIHWKFDGHHTTEEQKQVRNALQHWTEETCVRFKELRVNEPFEDNHILFTRQSKGCYSYVGKVNLFPQPINLGPSCFERFGTPVHQIGHALGLWHEEQRPDRDDYVRIVNQTTTLHYYISSTRQFADTSVPYNYNSLMHSLNPTMIKTLNPLYQRNIGQRVGLSFLTSKLINVAYCNATCKTDLPLPCQRQGYQDPNHCDRCRCPDGFGGTYCQDVAPPVNGNCGGEFVATSQPQVIRSPGYDTVRHYENKQECNWMITAPPNHVVEFRFEDEFGVYTHTHGVCYHWVEVHYGKHFGSPGPRFCGNIRMNKTIESETSEMVITFRSNFTLDQISLYRGFKASFVAVDPASNISSPDPAATVEPLNTTDVNGACFLYNKRRLCQNGGTCVASETSALCVCVSGYAGVYCDVSSNSKTTNVTGIIVGIVFGTILIIGTLICLVSLYRRKLPRPEKIKTIPNQEDNQEESRPTTGIYEELDVMTNPNQNDSLDVSLSESERPTDYARLQPTDPQGGVRDSAAGVYAEIDVRANHNHEESRPETERPDSYTHLQKPDVYTRLQLTNPQRDASDTAAGVYIEIIGPV